MLLAIEPHTHLTKDDAANVLSNRLVRLIEAREKIGLKQQEFAAMT